RVLGRADQSAYAGDGRVVDRLLPRLDDSHRWRTSRRYARGPNGAHSIFRSSRRSPGDRDMESNANCMDRRYREPDRALRVDYRGGPVTANGPDCTRIQRSRSITIALRITIYWRISYKRSEKPRNRLIRIRFTI